MNLIYKGPGGNMSDINTNKIDRNFPEPGRDNDSFGFRNNFSEISDNLDITKTEIEDIQENVARTDQDSDFNGQKIIDVDLVNSTEQVYDIGNLTTDSNIDFSNGSYQTLRVTADITLTLSSWPISSRKASLTIALLSDNTERAVQWDVEGSGAIKRNVGVPIQLYDSTDGSNVTVGAFPNPFLVNSENDPLIVEFWTVDGGHTVYANYIGQFV